MSYKEIPGLLDEHGPMISGELADKTSKTKSACKKALRDAFERGLVERRYRVSVDVIAGTYEYYVPEGEIDA